jgi:hypothetical protein
VLYIGGTGRTGSTVLDSLLGSFPGVFSAGEMTWFWQYGLRDGGRCSCGDTITTCPVWSATLESAFGSVDAIDADRMVALRRRFWSGHLPLMIWPSYRKRGLRRIEEFPSVVEKLYRSLARTVDAKLIVDSSKEPHYSYILRESTDLDVYFLHLVRDPRAIGRSWLRSRPETGFDGRVEMDRRNAAKASLYFDVSNIAAEAIWWKSERYAFMRYEDFVLRPADAVRSIGRFVGVDLPVGDVLDADDSFVRPLQHSAWGNPNRFDGGRIRLRPDDAWKDQLGTTDRAVLTSMTLPLIPRYGYRVTGASRGSMTPRGRPATRRIVGATT